MQNDAADILRADTTFESSINELIVFLHECQKLFA